MYLEPQITIYKWLFQLDDSQSLHRKWLEIPKHLFINGCLGFQVDIHLLYDLYFGMWAAKMLVTPRTLTCLLSEILTKHHRHFATSILAKPSSQ